MATIKFFDRADEFRIELVGRFGGSAVDEVRETWLTALQENTPRRLSIDISRLSGYDIHARKLLSEMYRHGMNFTARTPSSLVFLDEIAKGLRAAANLITAPAPKEQKMPPPRFRVVAAGE